jgi:hypothetical protein
LIQTGHPDKTSNTVQLRGPIYYGVEIEIVESQVLYCIIYLGTHKSKEVDCLVHKAHTHTEIVSALLSHHLQPHCG